MGLAIYWVRLLFFNEVSVGPGDKEFRRELANAFHGIFLQTTKFGVSQEDAKECAISAERIMLNTDLRPVLRRNRRFQWYNERKEIADQICREFLRPVSGTGLESQIPELREEGFRPLVQGFAGLLESKGSATDELKLNILCTLFIDDEQRRSLFSSFSSAFSVD